MQSASRIRPDDRSDASLPRAVRNRASGLEGARATHGVSPSVVITPAPRSPGSALSLAARIAEAAACVLIVALVGCALFVDADVLAALLREVCGG